MKKSAIAIMAVLTLAAGLQTNAFADESDSGLSLVPAEQFAAEESQPDEMSQDITTDSVETDTLRPSRRFECFARNRRGRRFRAVGRFAPQVQARAMNECYRHGSRQCFEEGCRRF
jgi:hypothetical protein